MRPIWSGALSFGLVNIPVRAYSAIDAIGLNFDMLHKKDLSPIRYARICREDGKEVPYEDIVKGYEIAKGEYVVLTDEDFKKANIKKTKTIEIVDFAELTSIDPLLFEKPYFLEPDKGGDRAYALLREALKRSGKVGIATFVFRNREHLGAVLVHENIIVLNQLRYQSEIRQPEGLALPEKTAAREREMTMALQLIEQLTEPFKPEVYKDNYAEELMELIHRKAKGKAPRARGKAPRLTATGDLVHILKESLRSSHRPALKKRRTAA